MLVASRDENLSPELSQRTSLWWNRAAVRGDLSAGIGARGRQEACVYAQARLSRRDEWRADGNDRRENSDAECLADVRSHGYTPDEFVGSIVQHPHCQSAVTRGEPCTAVDSLLSLLFGRE